MKVYIIHATDHDMNEIYDYMVGVYNSVEDAIRLSGLPFEKKLNRYTLKFNWVAKKSKEDNEWEYTSYIIKEHEVLS